MKNISKFSMGLVGVLFLTACASGNSESDLAEPSEDLAVEIEEQPAEQIWDLLPSSFPREAVAPLSPITDDLEELQTSLDLFDYEEGDGRWLDYELKFNSRAASGRRFNSEAALASNRERDDVRLTISPYSVRNRMENGPIISAFVSFQKMSGMDRQDQALCQGMLFEVAGEAIYLEEIFQPYDPAGPLVQDRESTCKLPLEHSFESRSLWGEDLTDESDDVRKEVFEKYGTTYRLLQLLTEHPFTVRVLDLRGTEHVFISDEPLPFRAAFEAEKAVKSGLGY